MKYKISIARKTILKLKITLMIEISTNQFKQVVIYSNSASDQISTLSILDQAIRHINNFTKQKGPITLAYYY